MHLSHWCHIVTEIHWCMNEYGDVRAMEMAHDEKFAKQESDVR